MTAEPRAVIVAGPNGSGKTTLTRRLRILALPDFTFPETYINADDIAAVLHASGVPDPEYAAFLEGRWLRQAYREERRSFAYETVFSHPSGVLDLMRLREAGYRVTLIIVTTRHPSLNVERVRRRVLMGGHDVPADRIIARHRRCIQLLPRAIETVDQAWVFDSTDRIRLILAYRAGDEVKQQQVPRYMASNLVRPLQERKTEREAAMRGDARDLIRAEESGGKYVGDIKWLGQHFLIQDCADQGHVLHDRSMSTGEPGRRMDVQIGYQQGAGGFLAPS